MAEVAIRNIAPTKPARPADLSAVLSGVSVALPSSASVEVDVAAASDDPESDISPT
jgi:hypothetical protein